MGMRRQGREMALQALYAVDLNPMEVRKSLRLFWEQVQGPAQAKAFAEKLVFGVAEQRETLDARIKEKSKNWSLGRMSKVDLNILRLAVFELLFLEDIPRNVSLNEAIEIAKIFGTEDSPAFINGILDEIAQEVPEKVAQQADQ